MPERVQRKRTKGWRMPPNTVSVGRGNGMMWGNPWLGENSAAAVHQFRQWLAGDPTYMHGDEAPDPQRDFILANIGSLRGKNLACWCPLDRPCHADVLLELANGSHGEEPKR